MGSAAEATKRGDGDTNPFVFIVGCPRSGTTLLRRIVNAHSQVAITPETQWLPRYFAQRVGLTADGQVTPALLPRLLGHPRFADLGIGREAVEGLLATGAPMSYARFVGRLFDLYGRAEGKALVGDKTPGYVRKIRGLHALWPRAKFVHLIRDGRDVCLSALGWQRKADRLAKLYPTWAEEPVITAALWWQEHVSRGRRHGKDLGPGLYYEMRYEALVTNPAQECARLCAFLGVPYEDAMLRFHEGRTLAEPGLSAKDAWLPITPGLRDWRQQMPAADVERFEAAAGPLLGELGYARAVPHPGVEARDKVARVVALLPEQGAEKNRLTCTITQSEGHDRMSPLVFIVGCARSGTTLLQRVVDAHPQIAITPEMHWITAYFRDKKKWLAPHGRVNADQVAAMIANTKRFSQFDFTPEEFMGLLRGEPAPYVDFLNRLFELYRRHNDKPFVGNKTPAYVRRIPILHRLWPDTKFVHIIRDGRDVCLSVLNWYHADRTAGRYSTWQEDPVSTTALWWERKVRLGRQGGQALRPGLYYELSYDRFVHHPAEECAKLCAFLGVPYEERMLRFYEGRTKNKPGLDAKKAWLPITPGLRNWRTQMSPEDQERFEAVVGGLLDELGYERAFPRPSAAALRHADCIRGRFTEELHAQEEAMPDSW